MGGLFKSKTTQTKEPFESNPWKPQQDYLKIGFKAAESGLKSANTANAGITDFVADMSPEQKAALDASNGFQAGVIPGANGAVAAGSAGVGGLQTFQGNAASLTTNAGMDRTGQVIDSASQYADNPYLQGNIDAAIGDVRRGFDQDLAGINSGASATGNINSTRAGVVESLARDDAMDRAGQISAGMRGDAYNQGLGLASQNISDQYGQSIGANQQVGQGAAQAVDTLATGQQIGQGALGQTLANTSMEQAQRQAEIDGMRAKGMSELEIAQAFSTAVGGSYGTNGFNTTTQKEPSMFQQLVGGATSVMGAWGGMK